MIRDVINLALLEGWALILLFALGYWGIWWPLQRARGRRP